MKLSFVLVLLPLLVFSCKNRHQSPDDAERETEESVTPNNGDGSVPDQNSNPDAIPGTPGAATSNGYVASHGFLKAVRGKLVDKNNQAIQLRGMSLFWSQYAPQFWNKGVVESLRKQWKSNVVRAAMGIEDGGYLTNPQVERDRVKLIVDAAIAQDMYVIIDWHDHNATAHPQQAVAFFTEMAKAYANVPNVMFEVFNEPDFETWLDVKAYAETVIKAIRGQGAKNLVIVGSPTWSQRVDQAADNPITIDDNIAYTLHFYAGTHRQELRDKAVYAMNKGLTLFVTEFGVCDASGNGNVDLVETETWMKFMDQYQLSWANWALNDKLESASALKSGASKTGAWTDADLTESGAYVKKKILLNVP